MSRRWLIAVSVGAHLAVGVGLFVTGVWHLERLHADPFHNELVLSHDLPAPSGGPVASSIDKINPKHHIPTETVQPVPTPDHKPAEPSVGDNPGPGNGSGDTPVIGTCTENCGEAKAAVPVCGDGSVDVGEQCDDGNTTDGDGCSSTCRTEAPPRPKQTAMLAPNVLQGLRISGETQLHPSATTQNMMIRDGASRMSGTVKVCIATDGGITSASMATSTKYPDYDATLLSAVRNWRYRPYTLNGAPLPACSFVTFVYTLR